MQQNYIPAFVNSVQMALSAFPNTAGQCVALCAAVSRHLTAEHITHKIALGSLSCYGVLYFKYTELNALERDIFSMWDGHAWIEFPDGAIGEPSLLRTARAAPAHSHLRRSLEAQGVLSKGALLMSRSEAIFSGLNYEQVSYLDDTLIEPLIGGLLFINKS